MITVKIGDGLGNQIYNYVCGYAVAKHYGEPLCLDISDAENNPIRSYQLDIFNLEDHRVEYFPNKNIFQKIYKRLRRNLKYRVIFEKGYASFDDNKDMLSLKNHSRLYLYGYWQSIKFFEMYEEDLRKQLTPRYEMAPAIKNKINELKNSATCAIHLRGGDIAMPEADYFIKAIKMMSEFNSQLEYIVFTNDKEKALTRLGNLNIRYRFIDQCFEKDLSNSDGDSSQINLTDIDEFFLMSACQNQIVSESTFSTWAAILNDNVGKIVIAPIVEQSHERCPANWIYI